MSDLQLNLRETSIEALPQVLALSREARCFELALSSNLNRTRAHAFCESAGFECHGLRFLVPL